MSVPTSSPETVLVVGSTGNIGISAITSALLSNRNVLAVVRNAASAAKLFSSLPSLSASASEKITTVEADVLSDTETGIKGVVEKVKMGELPGFRHVFSCVGGDYNMTPLLEITTQQLRYNLNAAFEANFFAYKFTIPYLLTLGPESTLDSPTCTYTICTGSQGTLANFPLPAIPQGALFSFCTAACRENSTTNIRFNEIYLGFRVEKDADAEKSGATKASDFAEVYRLLLGNEGTRSMRVMVEGVEDLTRLRGVRKF